MTAMFKTQVLVITSVSQVSRDAVLGLVLGTSSFTARSSYTSAVLGIVILSVRRPSVTRVLCDETKEHTAAILTHESVINLVF